MNKGNYPEPTGTQPTFSGLMTLFSIATVATMFLALAGM